MRIHRLELQAFGPFASQETVDFAELNEAGLFLLDGPTGAGKSTVLAAICFALYGSVPGGRSAESLASTQAPLGSRPEVLLDFTIGARRFEVRRWPKHWRPAKRKAKNGVSLTEEKAGAVLREHRSGEWVGVSVRADEIGHLLRQQLYLDADQFMRVAMLPQGEFANFLRAKSADKEALLRKLFGTGRYDSVETHLAEQHRRQVQAVQRDRDLVAAARTELLTSLTESLGRDWSETGPDTDDLSGPEEWTDERLSERSLAVVAQAVESSHAERQQAVTELAAAQGRLDALVRQQQDLDAYAAWKRRRDQHETLRSQVEADRTAVERHQAARSLERRATEADRATAAHRRERELLDQAIQDALTHPLCAEWAATGPSEVQTPEQFAGMLQQAERELSRLSDREHDATRLAEAQQRCESLHQSLEDLTRVSEDAQASRETLLAQHEELLARIERLSSPAAGLEAARVAAQEAAARHEAAVAHQQDHAAAQAAEKALHAATDRAHQAVDDWHAVVEQRLAGAASLLAAELQPGEPCLVCGSPEHPRPAAPGGEEMSSSAHQRARRHMEEATAAREQAQADVDRARRTAEDSRLRAGGLDPAGAEEALNRAHAAVAEAEQAHQELESARAEQQRNEAEQRELATQWESARDRLAVVRTELAGAVEERDRLSTALAETLGSRDSLAALRRELETAKTLVEAVLDAVRRESTADSLGRQASESLTQELDESRFESVEQVRAAILAPDEATKRTERIRAWDQESAALAELQGSDTVTRGHELVEAGTETPSAEDLRRHSEQVEAAALQRDSAAERAGALESLQKLVRRQTGILDEVAERSSELVAASQETEALLKLVRGAGENSLKMPLGSYVLAGRLEEVVASATERLLGMTQGRYELRHDDSAGGRGVRGLDITVFDRYTEDERAADTLSGGETFMASLALALGLADTVQAEAGGVDMDTLFVDEGFGSLDTATLADVMDVLDGLQAGGRTIGVVSHVDRMKQDIGYRLEVLKSQQGSRLRVVVPDHPVSPAARA
ncbi:AAA family ATPase [Citricoccus sp. GCM10030269]|uniref:AAA family ATPase n=1 Tax=Citricoccus sp. GCM10030269 TaxID=3273388 RepID=UPI003618CC15